MSVLPPAANGHDHGDRAEPANPPMARARRIASAPPQARGHDPVSLQLKTHVVPQSMFGDTA